VRKGKFLTPRSSFLTDFQGQPLPDEIPVPGVATDAAPGILEWLELQAAFWQTYRASVIKQALAVSRHEVGHLAPVPHVSVEPEATVHRVDHPLTTLRELDVVYGRGGLSTPRCARSRYWQTTTPSVVAGGSAALPT
jgi:hypothetical protein